VLDPENARRLASLDGGEDVAQGPLREIPIHPDGDPSRGVPG
jgi:hypothetical protein